MAMFIGFMDGDGYFDIGEQKQYNKVTKALVNSTIRIRLASNVHVRDLSLLEYFVRSSRSRKNIKHACRKRTSQGCIFKKRSINSDIYL